VCCNGQARCRSAIVVGISRKTSDPIVRNHVRCQIQNDAIPAANLRIHKKMTCIIKFSRHLVAYRNADCLGPVIIGDVPMILRLELVYPSDVPVCYIRNSRHDMPTRPSNESITACKPRENVPRMKAKSLAHRNI
jgi:hypothetical protein